MAAPAAPISGRKPFRGMGPKGYRLRMMEPGEAEVLLSIRQASGEPGEPPPDMAEFIRLILAHEVYVAVAKRSGEVAGYAAAAGAGPVYRLVEHRVAPEHRGRGVGSALLAAVTLRARWFGHRALALCGPVGRGDDASFYRHLGFAPDLPLRPDPRATPETPVTGRPAMVKWL